MIDDETETVLGEIFGRHSGWENGSLHRLKMSPGFKEITQFAGLLSDAPCEERLQEFLTTYPQFLLGLFGRGDEIDLAFLTKPPVGTSYYADFGLLTASQGGAGITLVEIERSDVSLFTQRRTPAKELRNAIGQLRDWRAWIRQNKSAFVDDMLSRATSTPMYPDRAENGSFRTRTSEDIESSWRAFGGHKNPLIDFGIIISRWSNLTSAERERLLALNTERDGPGVIYTYDQVARRAYDRPHRFP